MATNKIAADAAVLAEDVVEEVAEQATEVVTIVKNNPILLAGVAVVAASAGGFAGYKFAEKRLRTKYDQLLKDEIEKTREFLKDNALATELGEDPAAEIMDNSEEKIDPQVEAAVRALRQYNKSPVSPQQKLDEDDLGGTAPSETEPYLISFNEFHSQNDPSWTQLALTYYAEDDVLAGEDDQMIDNVRATIGEDNLEIIRNTGKMTTFVRNPRTEMEFEVARYERSYAQTVLGQGEDG